MNLGCTLPRTGGGSAPRRTACTDGRPTPRPATGPAAATRDRTRGVRLAVRAGQRQASTAPPSTVSTVPVTKRLSIR
jgi:hypothetical protein